MRDKCEECNGPVEHFGETEIKRIPGNNWDIITMGEESYCRPCNRYYVDQRIDRDDRPTHHSYSTLRETNRTYDRDTGDGGDI